MEAGDVGIEPTFSVLETEVLPLNESPLGFMACNYSLSHRDILCNLLPLLLTPYLVTLLTAYFGLLMFRLFSAPLAELDKLKLALYFLLVLRGIVIPP